MIIIDAQLSPLLSGWINEKLNLPAVSVKELNFLTAEDKTIFFHARELKGIVMTKDEDFVQLLHQFGPPPKVLWITCGNTSNNRIKEILSNQLQKALELLDISDLVEISD